MVDIMEEYGSNNQVITNNRCSADQVNKESTNIDQRVNTTHERLGPDNNNSWHLLNLDWHFKGDEMGTQKRKRSAYIKSCQLR